MGAYAIVGVGGGGAAAKPSPVCEPDGLVPVVVRNKTWHVHLISGAPFTAAHVPATYCTAPSPSIPCFYSVRVGRGTSRACGTALASSVMLNNSQSSSAEVHSLQLTYLRLPSGTQATPSTTTRRTSERHELLSVDPSLLRDK